MLRQSCPGNEYFLGVAEEETKVSVGRCIMNASIDVNSFKIKSAGAVHARNQTEIYTKLLKGKDAYEDYGIMIELFFTNKKFWDLLKNNRIIEIIKVLNLAKARAERTILEVKIEGISKPMALKCIECEVSDVSSGRVVTLVQKEIIAFDNIPDNIKVNFAEKYAHGRLWFNNSSYEVILMEKMSTTLDQAFTSTTYDIQRPIQYVYLANAFRLLHTIHAAGYSHGDAHGSNIMWTDEKGRGDLKFIDPERMINLKNQRTEVKNILKLCDISHVLFCNFLAYSGIKNKTPSQSYFDMDFRKLHQRLKNIKKNLVSYGKNYQSFVFDSVFPYSRLILFVGTEQIDRIEERIIKPLQEANEEQYNTTILTESLGNQLDDFTQSLTDPSYLNKVFVYILNVYNRSMEGSVSISIEELNYPMPESVTASPPLSPVPVRPIVPLPNSRPDPVVAGNPNTPPIPNPIQFIPHLDSTKYPLTYKDDIIQMYDETDKTYNRIYFSFGVTKIIMLYNLNPSTLKYKLIPTYEYRIMYAKNKKVKKNDTNDDIYFRINQDINDSYKYFLRLYTYQSVSYRLFESIEIQIPSPKQLPTNSNQYIAPSKSQENANVSDNGMGTFPLMFHGYQIQVKRDRVGCLNVFYKINTNGSISLHLWNRPRMEPYNGNNIETLYWRNMMLETSSHSFYFKFDYDLNTLVILKSEKVKAGQAKRSTNYVISENVPFVKFHQHNQPTALS